MIQSHLILLQFFLFISCSNAESESVTQNQFADVTQVAISGSESNYTFSVTISSPDTGCEQYADWWEVVSETGELLFRRILLHSHVSEQPITRSGGAVAISENQIVWVRAHINNKGYGGQAMQGSVKDGFQKATFPEDLGEDLDQVEPLPSGCNF